MREAREKKRRGRERERKREREKERQETEERETKNKKKEEGEGSTCRKKTIGFSLEIRRENDRIKYLQHPEKHTIICIHININRLTHCKK